MKLKDIAIHTNAFLLSLSTRAKAFKQNKGFGRWIKEYQRMDEQGLFEPKALKQLCLDMLNDSFKLGFICKQAVYAIYVYAIDDTIAYLRDNSFIIYNSDGSLYKDEDGDTMEDLEFLEALDICKAINDDALDYVVYIGDENNNFIYQE